MGERWEEERTNALFTIECVPDRQLAALKKKEKTLCVDTVPNITVTGS